VPGHASAATRALNFTQFHFNTWSPSMKTRLNFMTAMFCGSAAMALAPLAGHAAPTLSYIGQQIVPSGTAYNGTTVGGLSGIDYDAANNRYFAISDDRSGINAARFYTLQLNLSAFQRSATPGSAGVSFTSVTTLQTPGGAAFASNTVDPESIRFNAASNTLYWTNEGQRSGAGFQNPTVRETTLGGVHVRDFAVPDRYKPAGSNSGLAVGDRGIYNNLAFESLSLSSDRKTLWTATENALAQDSLPSTALNGSRARLLSFDVASGAAGAEYVYDVSPVALAPNPAGAFATNGLTDLLAIGDGQWIAIERSFAAGAVTPGTPVTGNTIRLYLADARGATDVSALDSLAGQPVAAVNKTLLLDLSTLLNDDGSALALDNIEGLSLGQTFDGKPVLMLVSDNNFSGTQFTQFVALSLVDATVPEPGSMALVVVALVGMVAAAQRRRTAPPSASNAARTRAALFGSGTALGAV